MAKSKKVSIAFMMFMTVFLTFLDVKDLYYKITIYELVSVLKENNGTWTSNANMWNALAMQCDSLQIFKITTIYASLSAIGKSCKLGGVKRMEPLVFVGSIRVNSFVWGAELLAGVIHEPFPTRAYTSTVYSLTYNQPESTYAATFGAMIAPEDVSVLNKSTRLVFDQFEYGKSVEDALPQEYGCIWSDPTGKDLHVVHVDKAASKYFQTLSNWVGWGWLTIDSLHVRLTLSHLLELDMGLDGVLYYVMLLVEVVIILINSMDSWVVALLVVRPLTVVARNSKRGSSYLSKISSMIVRSTKSFAASKDTSTSSTTGDNKPKKDETLSKMLLYTDLSCVAIEVLIILINSLDAWVVALLVVRPLVLAVKRNSSYTSRISSTADTNRTSSHASSGGGGVSTNENMANPDKSAKKAKKDETLSKMLLYTDLSCVAFRKQLLALLLVIDAFFSWLYIVPNSTLYAWSTSTFQIGSAYLSNFRVWTVVLVFIDQAWRWTFVLANERLAALITEFTHITSFEIMLSTLLAVYLSYDDLLNVCIVKWGLVDSQRQLVMLTPAMGSFYNSFSMHTYGGRNNEHLGVKALYNPLFDIIRNAMLFGLGIIVLRLIVNVGIRHFRGIFLRNLEVFWRTYHRNSVEVFMNDPLRAKALVH